MKVLKEPEIDQWKAVPRRYPPPSPTPNRMANGSAIRRLMIGPTAMHAIRLSVPSSRKPMVGPFRDWREPCSGGQHVPSTTLGYASLARLKNNKNSSD